MIEASSVLSGRRTTIQGYREMLLHAVSQRGRAILAFIKDHYSGCMLYRKYDIIAETTMERLISRYGDRACERSFKNLDSIRFWYGTDMIRTSDGRFHVVDHQSGHLVGMSDLLSPPQSHLERFSELEGVSVDQNPICFYEELVRKYRSSCQGGGKAIVLLAYSPPTRSDHKDRMTEKIFEQFGVETVYLKSNPEDKRTFNSLKVKNDGVYLHANGRSVRKVGFLISNVEPREIDPNDCSVFQSSIISIAREFLAEIASKLVLVQRLGQSETIKKVSQDFNDLQSLLTSTGDGKLDSKAIYSYLYQFKPSALEYLQYEGIPGILKAFFRGQIGMVNPPGIDLVGDKEFFSYVDKLIHFYLGEEPIVASIPTESFRAVQDHCELALNQDLFNLVFNEDMRDHSSYVIKKVGGFYASPVWVGAKMGCWEEFKHIGNDIKADPGAYICQQYGSPKKSRPIGRLRLLADVSPQGTTVVSMSRIGFGTKDKGENFQTLPKYVGF